MMGSDPGEAMHANMDLNLLEQPFTVQSGQKIFYRANGFVKTRETAVVAEDAETEVFSFFLRQRSRRLCGSLNVSESKEV